ncbi:MAG: hypothetical protein ACI383_06020 [Rummeliibacillus sp.]|mgnify:CR=1 FL=1
MKTKETLFESLTFQLKQGLWEMDDFFNERIKNLELETEHKKHQMEEMQKEKEALLVTIKTLKKINLELNNDREMLLKKLDKKLSRSSVTGILTILLCEDELENDKQIELLKELLKLAIHEEKITKYIREFIHVICNAFTFMDYYQKRTIKRELKKNYDVFNQLFLNAQLSDIRKILIVYHSEKLIDPIDDLLEKLIHSECLYNYIDEDALNIFLYIIYYDKIEQFKKYDRFQKYFNSERIYYSRKIYSLYKLYSIKKDISILQSIVEIFRNKEACIDLFKTEMIKKVLNKIFNIKIEHFNNLYVKETYIKPEDYIYRHPNYSELRNYGYQITNRTDEQRWKSLQKYLNEHSLQETVNELNKRIRLKLGREEDKKRYANAIEKWRFDLNRLKEVYYENDFPWPDIDEEE